jgi:hypothetical protein
VKAVSFRFLEVYHFKRLKAFETRETKYGLVSGHIEFSRSRRAPVADAVAVAQMPNLALSV